MIRLQFVPFQACFQAVLWNQSSPQCRHPLPFHRWPLWDSTLAAGHMSLPVPMSPVGCSAVPFCMLMAACLLPWQPILPSFQPHSCSFPGPLASPQRPALWRPLRSGLDTLCKLQLQFLSQARCADWELLLDLLSSASVVIYLRWY